MRLDFALALMWILVSSMSLCAFANEEQDDNEFTNHWALLIEGDPHVVSAETGMKYLGRIGSLQDWHLFSSDRVHPRSRRDGSDRTSSLLAHAQVKQAAQQRVLRRSKRELIDYQPGTDFNDPLFPKQWHLNNKAQQACDVKDINVRPVWERNITGRGTVISILDDGVDFNHPDLIANYEPRGSYDFNSNDSDPSPRYTANDLNKHGTRCAGEIAAAANNLVCGVGVAFNAKMGGLRILDGAVTDYVEAASISFAPNVIDIYSSSWGPDDDGRTVDGPGILARQALENGVKIGRLGLGSLYVWATGNGGAYQDNCGCDGYINSIYTISIGAVDMCGKAPYYTEQCPATMAVSYSSGSGTRDMGIVTTDLHNKCTNSHTGTSAAAPLVAGAIALALEVNPNLSWREVQHLVVNSARWTDPEDSSWQINAAGLRVNPKYGFGIVDAKEMVRLAEDWVKQPRLGPQRLCECGWVRVNSEIPQKGMVTSKLFTDGCANRKSCVDRLEHVQVTLTVFHHHRGSLQIFLTSPSGVVSPLLRPRPRDVSSRGFSNWTFLTVFNWGENPTGTWSLRAESVDDSTGSLVEWSLLLHGTCDKPTVDNNEEIPKDIEGKSAKACSQFCLQGCPHNFSLECSPCSKYCDCASGQCVDTCTGNLVDLVSDPQSCRQVNWKVASNPSSWSGLPLSYKLTIVGLCGMLVAVVVGSSIFLYVKWRLWKKTPIPSYAPVSSHPMDEPNAVRLPAVQQV